MGIKEIVKLIFDGITSSAALFVLPILMIVATWGMAGNWISYFWVIVLFSVLIGEILNKVFSPEKKTVSSNIRIEVQGKYAWRIWAMLIMWLAFSVQLFFHFIKPIWMAW